MSAETDQITRTVDHRPWPLPSGSWIMFQSWQKLLFAHWPLPAVALRPHVPPELSLDEHDGAAWVGLTPFVLSDLHLRGLPPVPGASHFPEMNLRTYVRREDRPGIYFFSLDAANRLAVVAARTLYRLPYRTARMRVSETDGWVDYRSQRSDGSAALAARYRSRGDPFQPAPGTLEHFLTERYALYVVLRDRSVVRGDIHHLPWTLRAAEADIERNTVARAAGVTLPDRPPLLHFAGRQDTVVWPPRVVD